MITWEPKKGHANCWMNGSYEIWEEDSFEDYKWETRYGLYKGRHKIGLYNSLKQAQEAYKKMYGD